MLLSVAVLGGLLASCGSDDTAVEPTVQENNIPNGTDKYTLSVHVYSSSENAKAAGLDGAQVTINQEGGETTTTVGADGIATFSNLRQGDVSWYVTADGHVTMNGATNLEVTGENINDSEYGEGYDSEQIYFVRANVNLPRANGSIAGKFYYFDEDGDFQTAVTAVTITFPTSLEPNVFTTNTAADGTFSISGLPEGVEGNCEGSITVTEERGPFGDEFDIAIDKSGDFDFETSGSSVDNHAAVSMGNEE